MLVGPMIDGVYAADRDGVTLLFNAALLRIMKFDGEEKAFGCMLYNERHSLLQLVNNYSGFKSLGVICVPGSFCSSRTGRFIRRGLDYLSFLHKLPLAVVAYERTFAAYTRG